MKVVTPIVALATLASVSDAAIDKENTRSRKKSILHKVDVDGTSKSIIEQAKESRRQRDGRGHFEKVTNVKMEHILRKGLTKHPFFNEKREKAPTGDGASSTSVEKEAASADGATPSESTGFNKRGSSRTSTLLRKPDNDATFEFEEWSAHAAEAADVPTAKAKIPDRHQKLMQKRRRDSAADFGVKKMGIKQRESMLHDHLAAKASNVKKQNERRTTSATEPPASRPGRFPASGKPTARQRYDERELKKSKKSSKSSTGKAGKSGGNEDECVVRMTNLTKEQWFSDTFWMVHSDKVDLPLWSFGRPAFSDLAALAQDGDPDELIDFYEDNDDGVLDVDSERGPIRNGESIFFEIPKSGSYNLFTMATSFIFSNDGFVSIDAGEIEDGATWFLWGLDAGVEANTQLCWTVQATSNDFPPNSDCYFVDEEDADENDNEIPGEGFVHVHNGIHNFEDKKELEEFLQFTCDDLEADSFVEYFQIIGYDDDYLLYDDDRARNERDDQSFLDVVEDFDDRFGDIPVFRLAVRAGDFDQFCDDLEDISDFLINAFETLEPPIFDFRTPMMRVQMAC
mmetsp:Transcript_28315/g.59812  ORF Transcript_28315/g.59812 Transcript_28315/m.59812 type:complete len:570 (-) Transcript_28315:175-1884(-)